MKAKKSKDICGSCKKPMIIYKDGIYCKKCLRKIAKQFRKKSKICVECGEHFGEFRVYTSKKFKKEYGRKGFEKGLFCIDCIYDYLSGSKMGFYPEYIKKIKRKKNYERKRIENH